MGKIIICIVCRGKQKKVFRYQAFDYYRCQNCGLVSTHPIPTNRAIVSHYEDQARSGNYKLLLENRESYMTVYRQFLQILEEELKKDGRYLNGISVLDVGCFTGDFLELVKSQGGNAYGLELQEEAVRTARQRLGKKVIQGDILTYNFGKEKFDVITLFGLIEHVTNPNKVLIKTKFLLKRGGILLIQTPNSGSLLARVMGKYWPPYSPIEHIHIFSKHGLSNKLGKLGFKISLIKNHWKHLPIEYIFNNFQTFGPEFYRFFSRVYSILPAKIKHTKIPVFIGEIIVSARK